MNAFSLTAFANRIAPRSWTCSTCRSQLIRNTPFQNLGARGFALGRNSRAGGQRSEPKRALLFASAGAAAVGASTLAFTDNIKNGYEAAERTGRVAITLAVCINEYVVDGSHTGYKSGTNNW